MAAAATLDQAAWPKAAKKAYAKAVYEENLMADMLGRLNVIDEAGAARIAREWFESTGRRVDPEQLLLVPDDGPVTECYGVAKVVFERAVADFKRRKVLSKREFDALVAEHKAAAWTIAGDHDDYTREQVKASLTKAIEEGTNRDVWIKSASDMFKAMGVTGLGLHHLETVFETSVFSAYQHGRYRQQTTPAMMAMRPVWRYRTIGDSHVRESHRAMDGFTARADDPIWSTWYPPNGYRCRCRVEALADGEAPLSDEAPSVQPDKGWDRAPGQLN